MNTLPGPRVEDKDFQNFLERLKNVKEGFLAEGFDLLLSKKNFVEIIDYFLLKRKRKLEEDKVPPEVKSTWQKFDFNNVRSLNRGGAYRLSKESTGLARTLNVIRDDSGEFWLIIETKSKLQDGTKQFLPEIAGSFKSGKPCWRGDRANSNMVGQEYFNLVIKTRVNNRTSSSEDDSEDDSEYSTEEKYINVEEEAETEVNASRLFRYPQINQSVSGQLFFKGKYKKISLYSVKAEGTLADLQKHKELTVFQTDDLIIDLLMGVKRIHDEGYVHQDLKEKNILYYEDSEKYYLKIADFGTLAKEGDTTSVHGTCAYWPPEVFYFRDMADDSSRYGLGNDIFLEHSNLYPADAHKLDSSLLSSFDRPHSANDMWALGLIIFKMRHGRGLHEDDGALVKKDPLLRGLLEPDRRKRLTVEKALLIALYHSAVPEEATTSNSTGAHSKVKCNRGRAVLACPYFSWDHRV